MQIEQHISERADLHKVNPHYRSDLDYAYQLIREHGDDLRYCPEWSQWFSWDGRRWSSDQQLPIELMQRLATRRLEEAARSTQKAKLKRKLLSNAVSGEAGGRIKSAVGMAAANPTIKISYEQLDCKPMLLNAPNGTIDLSTGNLLPHRRDDLLTQLCPVEYDPEAKAPTFDRFIREVCGGEDWKVEFLQQLSGYFLTGAVSEQILPVWYGSGCNGKSTLFGLLIAILGSDYASPAPEDFMLERRSDSHPTALAALFGKRLIVQSELKNRCKLREDLVKRLTGSERILARRMKENYWHFAPTFKCLLSTNYKPRIEGTDYAIWRRVLLVEFGERFSVPDKSLPDRLSRELPGILRWCVDGAAQWHMAGGLVVPAAVKRDTWNYRTSEDVVLKFVSQNCVRDNDASVSASELYAAFREFDDEGNLKQTAFGIEMDRLGFAKGRMTGGRKKYLGIHLRAESEQ